MSLTEAASRGSTRWVLVASAGLAIAAAGFLQRAGAGSEITYATFVILSGFAMGALAVLMIGHLMQEHWLAPIRDEAEAAALTLPLFLLLGIPLGLDLAQVFPWAGRRMVLAGYRAAFLNPEFFVLRSFCYIAGAGAVAYWVSHTKALRRASAIGLALLAPIMTFSAYDWVLSRDPQWWSSLSGFAFALSQVLAALAAAILITLLKPGAPASMRLASLERALLTLALLTLWTWFSQFLIVWMADLPNETAWYLARADRSSLMLIGGACAAMTAAVVVLTPSGVSRAGMIVGSGLVLLQHGLHMLWILRPAPKAEGLDLAADVAIAFGTATLWCAVFAMLMKSRPVYDDNITEIPGSSAR